MLVPNWCGGFYQTISPVMGADQAVNLYTETREIPGSAKQVWMVGTPGLNPLTTVPTTSCRGWFSQDARTFTVVGNTLYEIDVAGGGYTVLGTIVNDGFPVSFASNGKGGDQLAIVGGGQLKVFDLSANTLSAAVTLPFSGPVMIVFLDGYGLILEQDTPKVWFSALEDFTSWDALDFFARSGTSDNLVGLAVSRDRIWCLGSKTTTLFYNSGDADTPFVPYPGTAAQVGLVSPWLLGSYNDVVYWVGESVQGTRKVFQATDPQPQPISTPPIDLFLDQCQTLDTGELLAYEQAGHPFVVITCPGSEADINTYAYDVREQMWHARASWDSTNGLQDRWRGRGCTSASGKVLVGDYDTGDLYELDLETYDDNGTTIVRERVAPYLSAENQWLFIDQIELGVQSGIGLSTGQGSAPVISLSISRDGGHSYVAAGDASIGAIGEYGARAIWRRLGRVRADRLVIKATQSDPVKTVWGPGLWMRATNGSGEL